MLARITNLRIETAFIEEEVAEGTEEALEMQVEEEEGGEGEEGVGGTQRALEALEFLTQEAEPSSTTLIDGFNELSRLEMLWTVRHHWPAGARFAFNCHRHWVQLLLRQPGEPPVTILSIEGVTQVDPLSMVLYWITVAPLAEELRAADQGLLSPFYADDAAFDGSAQPSAQLLKMLTKRGPDRGYFPEPAKSLFISEIPEQEAEAKREFAAEGLTLNSISGSRYLGAYLGPQAELEAWVKPEVEAWAHGVKLLAKIARQHPPVGLRRIGNVVAIGVAVPSKDCPRSWHSDGSY